MICLHCGYCCIAYDVIIVHPDHLDKIINLTDHESLKEEWFIHKLGGEECPHLYASMHHEGKMYYSCKIHHLPWYEGTPCFEYGQIEESENSNCRTGDYKLNGVTFRPKEKEVSI